MATVVMVILTWPPVPFCLPFPLRLYVIGLHDKENSTSRNVSELGWKAWCEWMKEAAVKFSLLLT